MNRKWMVILMAALILLLCGCKTNESGESLDVTLGTVSPTETSAPVSEETYPPVISAPAVEENDMDESDFEDSPSSATTSKQDDSNSTVSGGNSTSGGSSGSSDNSGNSSGNGNATSGNHSDSSSNSGDSSSENGDVSGGVVIGPSTESGSTTTTEPPESTEATQPEVPAAETTNYEGYHAMSGAEQKAFMESFGSVEDFFTWYNAAKEAYEEQHPDIEIGDGAIDIGGMTGGN